MTNLLLTPVHRGAALGRSVVAGAGRLAAPVVSPLARPVAAGLDQAKRAIGHAPTVALGAVERLGDHLPAALGAHLPASQGELAALDARLAKLEAAAARPAARKAGASTAPRTRRA